MKLTKFKNYYSNNSIRSEGYKRIISIDDMLIRLIRKEDGEIFEPFYLNCYGKVYFFDESDNIIFMQEEALKKYETSYYKGGFNNEV